MYPWWQSLFFFYAIVCCDTERGRLLADGSVNFQTIQKRSISKTLLQLLTSPDVQDPGNRIPFWKLQVVSDVLRRYPVSDQYKRIRRSQKWYKSRIFKRAVENPDEFLIAFKAAIKEAVREILTENKNSSAQSGMVELWLKAKGSAESLPSAAEVNFLRSNDFLSKDLSSNNSHQTQSSIEPVQDIQILSTMKSLFTKKPEGTIVSSSDPAQGIHVLPTMKSPFTSKSEGTIVSSSDPAQGIHVLPTMKSPFTSKSEGTIVSSSDPAQDIHVLPTMKSLFTSKSEGTIVSSSDPAQDIHVLPTVKSLFTSKSEGTIVSSSDPAQDIHVLPTMKSLFTSKSEGTIVSSSDPAQGIHVLPTMKSLFTKPEGTIVSSNDPAQGKHLLSTMKSLFTSKSEHNILSSSEQVLKYQPVVQMKQPVTTLHFHYHDATNTVKSEIYTDVTTAPHSSNTLSLKVLSDSPRSITQESSDSITKDQFTKMINPVFESSTLGNILTSNFKTSAEKLGSTKLSIPKSSSTDFVHLTVTTATERFSSDRETVSLSEHSVLKNSHTSSPFFTFSSPYMKLDSSHSTFEIPRHTILATTKEALETSVSFASNNKFHDGYEIANTKDKIDLSSQMKSTSVYSVITSVTPIESNYRATKVSYPHKSTGAGTSENAGDMEKAANTAGTQLSSSLSSPKHFIPTERSIVSTETLRSETDYEMPSSVTSLPIMGRDYPACVLKVRNATTLQTRLLEQSTYEDDRTVYSPKLKTSPNSESNTLFAGTFAPTKSPSTMAVSPFTDLYSFNSKEDSSIVPLYLLDTQSPEPTAPDSTRTLSSATEILPASTDPSELPNTATLSLLDFDTFHDAIDGNVNSYQKTPRMTSTTVTFLPFWSSKFVKPITASSEEKILHTKPSLGAIQSMNSTRPTESTKPFFLVKYFSVTPVSVLRAGTTLHTKRSPILQTSTKPQSYNISTTTPKSNIFSTSTPIIQQSQAMRSTKHVMPTATLKPLFTKSETRSKSRTYASSTRTSRQTSETPVYKIWIPQFSDVTLTKSSPAVVAVPLTFHLTGISYSEQFGSNTTDEYRRLKTEVTLVLNKVFATKYQQEYVKAEILGFSKGSVVVKSNIVFGSLSSAPSGSDIVRTLLSDSYATKENYFGWKINLSTVVCNGYTPKNLALESLSIYFIVLRLGYIAISQNDQEKHNYLESLQKEMMRAINTSFPVTNIYFSQIRDFHGDLEVRGILYLESNTFTNVQVLLSTLLPLVNRSVDLLSITVDGMNNELQVYPFSFRVTNRQFVLNFMDMASSESQKLSKDLSKETELALHDKNLLQVVIREFFTGSVVCKGDLIYRFPAPGGEEVLRQFLQALTSDGMLGSSTYRVESQSVTIGEFSSSPYNEYTDFPGFAVAIIVMCGLSILIFPLLVYVCYKTRMLGHRNKATIRQRHDPDQQSHHFEMDNRAFRASIEQP